MKGKKNELYYAAITAVLVLAALVTLLLDYEKLRGLLAGIDSKFIIYAALFTAISYAAHSFSFLTVCRIFKIRIPLLELLEIGFVSSSLTNVLSAAGIPGNTYRIITMKREQVSAGDVTAITVFHTYFNNAVFFLLLPLSLLFVFNASFITKKELLGLAAAAAVFILLFLLSSAALFKKSLRERLMRPFIFAAAILKKKNEAAGFAQKFNGAIGRGNIESKRNPGLLVLLILFLVIDWVSMVLTLGYCFAAFGAKVGFGKLLVGFTSGIVAGAVSLLPGGLGIFEGSMAGMFAILGTGLENAVLAVLLFRFIYYLLPFALSLLFFGKIILESRREAKTT